MNFLIVNKFGPASGIRDGALGDLDAAKIAARKAAELGECFLSMLPIYFLSLWHYLKDLRSH
jgi:hypothetical protein